MCDLNIQCKCKAGKCGALMSKEKREVTALPFNYKQTLAVESVKDLSIETRLWRIENLLKNLKELLCPKL